LLRNLDTEVFKKFRNKTKHKKTNIKIMKFSEKKVDEVKKIIKKHRLVADRENELRKKGFEVAENPMGPGGTGQIKTLKSEIRMQIGYGHGKWNYAKCVIFSH
jgi:hypothetical protein